MTRQFVRLGALSLALVSACASAPDVPSMPDAPSNGDAGAFPSTPLATVTSDSGKLSIEVRTGPVQPPTRGELSVQLAVHDKETGAPVPGLALGIAPWMPAMGHGTSITPEVSESAPGVYVVTNVYLFMPGTWQLRTSITGALSDHVVPSLQIP